MVVRKGPKEWAPGQPSDVREVHHGQCLVIRAPKWFARADFQQWRMNSGIATWRGKDVQEQDVFIVFADGELDWLTKGMPDDIFRKIMRTVDAVDMIYGVVWIKAV